MICLSDLPLKGALKEDQLEIIENGALLLDGKLIYKTGSFSDLLPIAKQLEAEIIEYNVPSICLPSYIDAHTHICFSGSRAKDYSLRNAGVSYLEIAKAGGGIWDTVQHTRQATEDHLTKGILDRLNELMSQGITTVEVKSGYGLSIEDELKMLNAISSANKQSELDLVITCLAAHIKPRDFKGSHKEYLDYISSTLFPILKEKNLCTRIDAFIEEEAFSNDIVRPYFQKAKEMGFDLTVHADQFTPGGSHLAVEMNAVSADHLEASGNKEIEMLAKSNVIAMALPGASIGLGCDFTPARKLLDAGACLAIASDWNPGSAPMGNLLIQACILGSYEKISNLELLAGITFRAAAAIKKFDRAILKETYLADFIIYEFDHYNEIFYHQGMQKPSEVWKSGNKMI